MSHIPEQVYHRMAEDIERLFSEEGMPPVTITAEPSEGYVRVNIPPDMDQRSWYDAYSFAVSVLQQAGYTAAYMFGNNDPNFGAMFVVVYPNFGV